MRQWITPVNTPVNNGDVTVSVETGDNKFNWNICNNGIINIAGYTILKKEN